MPVTRENGERRQLGAQALITRSHKDTPFSPLVEQVLLLHDSAKELEAVAGVRAWRKASQNRLNLGLPGGGRGVTEDGSEETLLDTLYQEINEELGLRVGLLQAGVAFEQLAFPILVAQQKAPTSSTIDVFAATGAIIPYDVFDASAQAFITKNEAQDISGVSAEKPFVWQNSLLLAGLFERQASQRKWRQDVLDVFRPQVLGALYVYYLAELHTELEDATRKIALLNRGMYQWVVDEAARLRKEINNGAFSSRGETLADELSVPEHDYLYGTIVQDEYGTKRYTA